VLHQELPRIEASPLDGWGRWLTPALIAGAGLSLAIVLALAGQLLPGAIAAVAGLGVAGLAYLREGRSAQVSTPIVVGGPDYALVGSAVGLCHEPAALTTGEGSLLIANNAYRERFGGAQPPLELGLDEDGR